jgi:hydrogenase/urease accessory protein HupE
MTMNTLSIRSALLAGGGLLAAPLALSAHEGHAGDHGWLAGAVQPLLSLDHFLAGAFVALVFTIGVVTAARMRSAKAVRPGR